MKKTLNNIVKIMNDFSDAHPMVHSFGYGEIRKVSKTDNVNVAYPRVHVQVGNSTINQTHVCITFNCLFMDMVNNDRSNELEVMSDALLVLNHLFNYLNLDTSLHDNLILIDKSAELLPFSEFHVDVTNGWNLQIIVKVPNDGLCGIPFITDAA